MSEAPRPSLRPADWLLIVLTWPVAIGLVFLFAFDTWQRYVLNTPGTGEALDRVLAIFGVMLLCAMFLGGVLTVWDRWRGRGLPLTALVVWPGLPIGGLVVLAGLLVLALNSFSIAAPIEMLANPLASYSAAFTYMAIAMAALVFGPHDGRLVSVASAPVVLLAMPYLLGDLSIASGAMAQMLSLLAVVVVCGIAAAITWRAWPIAVACGGVVFGLTMAPILFGVFTPTEAFAVTAIFVAVPAIVYRLIEGGWQAIAIGLSAGSREMAGIAAAIGCSSVLPVLITFVGGSTAHSGDALLLTPSAATAVLSCVAFVAFAWMLTPLLTVAVVSSISALSLAGGPAQTLQGATLAVTVSLGLCAMLLREAYSAARQDMPSALLSVRAALALAAALFAIGLAAAMYLPRSVQL